MRRCNRSLVGLICIALGFAIIIGLILPGWVWMCLLGLALIGGGFILFL